MTTTEDTTDIKQPPTLAMRRLGARLHRHRRAAGKTRDDAAEALLCSHSKIYRLETGRTLAKPADVRELSIVYGVDEEELDELLRLARGARRPGVMDGYRDVVSGELSLLADLESVCSEMLVYEVEWMPGLVQCPEYSWAILDLIDVEDDVRKKRHQFRAERQRILLERDPHVDVRVVISEAAFRYEVGGPEVMRRQREHLADLVEAGVDIRVRKFSAGVHRWMAGGAFTVLGFPDRADPAVVYTESHLDSRYMETHREVAEYRAIFDDLRRDSTLLKEFS